MNLHHKYKMVIFEILTPLCDYLIFKTPGIEIFRIKIEETTTTKRR